jgi:hypothetical protein
MLKSEYQRTKQDCFQNVVGAFHDVRTDERLGRGIIIFCVFISFFAFRELRRVLGEDKFQDLFFQTGTISKSDLAGRQVE